jgi:hypothetical protein
VNGVEKSSEPVDRNRIIIKARQFDVKDVVTDLDDASNATDDSMLSVLEDRWEDPVADEIRGFIGALNEDEQIDLVALAWLGRGEGTIDDWDELRAEAARITDHSRGTISSRRGERLQRSSSTLVPTEFATAGRRVENPCSAGHSRPGPTAA